MDRPRGARERTRLRGRDGRRRFGRRFVGDDRRAQETIPRHPALYCGFAEARGEVVITMDADLQDSPDEIPELRRMILEEGYDLVSGWKKRRHDPAGKRWPSKFFNWTARTVSGIRLQSSFKIGQTYLSFVFLAPPA